MNNILENFSFPLLNKTSVNVAIWTLNFKIWTHRPAKNSSLQSSHHFRLTDSGVNLSVFNLDQNHHPLVAEKKNNGQVKTEDGDYKL